MSDHVVLEDFINSPKRPLDWPDEPHERLEAKIDHILDNHLKHLDLNQKIQVENQIRLANSVNSLVDRMNSKDRWGKFTSLACLIVIALLIL